MKKLFFLFVLLLAGSMYMHAQDITFKASAPESVVIGQPFRIEFSTNTDEGKDIRIPEMPKGLELLAGPYVSTSSYTESINGKMNNQVTTTNTYTLIAREEGTFDIPAATMKIKNSEYKSNTIRIKVLKSEDN